MAACGRANVGTAGMNPAAKQDAVLAIDAGGTATRALIADRSGHCIGFGQAGSGNPTSSGLDAALQSVSTATTEALAAGGGRIRLLSAAVAMAGAGRGQVREGLQQTLSPLGLEGAVRIEPDLLAMYHSGTIVPDGHVLLAGTGSVSAAVKDGELDAVADGLGWLVGDRGSGYWIGHQVVRAVAASFDGVAPPTALTELLLEALGLSAQPSRIHGRPEVLMGLIDHLYSGRPVELSRFAPLAFAARHDPAARAILAEAADDLASTLTAVRPTESEAPVVLGGSVLTALLGTELAGPLTTVMAPATQIRVQDGIVGAAVLALRRSGVDVDGETFDRLREELEELRAGVDERTDTNR